MRLSTMFFVYLATPSWLSAQLPGGDTLRVLDEVAREIRTRGAAVGATIWPGFRPDTLPLLFVLPGRGTVLANTELRPEGYVAVPERPALAFVAAADRGAASTSTSIAGRPAAQVVVGNLAREELFPVALHEAMHVYERAVARAGRRFGQGEASWRVSQYPLFDVENETGVALEGRLLAAALQARDLAALRASARDYVLVRERRLRRLSPDDATFEALAELNEGLAEYALLQGWRAIGRPLLAHPTVRRLEALTGQRTQSVRLRFYATGSAIALLLDRLQGDAWKRELVDADRTLLEQLAVATGVRDAERAAVARTDRRFDRPAVDAGARAAVTTLRAARRALADSFLARPGVRLELDGAKLPGHSLGLCGFDPQNMLPIGDGSVLHTRWLKVCGAGFEGEFTTPVVQAEANARLAAIIGPPEQVRVTVGGQPVDPATFGEGRRVTGFRIESPGLTLSLAAADVEREGTILRLRPVAP